MSIDRYGGLIPRNARALLRHNSQVLIDQVVSGRLMDLSRQDPVDRLTLEELLL
jgi:hypothetical protein